MQQYEIFQLKLFGEEPADNYVDVNLKAYFSQNGKTVCVKILHQVFAFGNWDM